MILKEEEVEVEEVWEKEKRDEKKEEADELRKEWIVEGEGGGAGTIGGGREGREERGER